MRRRPLALVLTAALIGAVFTALPAKAATEVPATPNIVDPAEDANHHSFASGQGVGLTLNGADILAVWFTEDADNVYTHIQTFNNARPESLTFVVYADPSKGAECMQLRTTTGGNFNDPFASVNLTADCGTEGTTVVGEVTEEEGPDGTSILTSKYPKADVPLLANGTTIKAPNALVGYNAQDATPRAGIIDDTAVGTDFSITGGGDVEPPVVEEPTEPKPAKNPCKKLKGKKKKKCLKKHAAKDCATFVPGELGAEAETLVVKDENTAEAPLEITLEHGPGAVRAEVSRSHVIKNLQIDSAASEAGLYIRYEFPEYEDHDLYLEDSAGNVVGQAAGSNQVSDVPEVGAAANEGTGIGGHSEMGAEVIDGLRTADCGGYTVDFDNFAGEGGEYIAKVWLGEPLNDPAAPAAKSYVF